MNSKDYLSRLNQKLYEAMLQPGSLRPKLTISKLMGFILALSIHAMTLYFCWMCLWNMVNGVIGLTAGSPIRVIGSWVVATGAFFVAWQLRPRIGRWPKEILERSQFPALYGLTDRIAKELKTSPINGIAITFDYNFACRKIGMQQKTLISLGLPLWVILSDQERIAFISHELAHNVNGDFMRGLVFGSAYQAVRRWYDFAVTVISSSRGRNLYFIFAPVWAISAIHLMLLQRLLLHESRRAEYLADKLAAEIGGTEAMLSGLMKLQFGHKFTAFVLYAPAASSINAIFNRFREYIKAVISDPTALQTVEHDNIIRDAHYNFTHPPMTLRQEFLEAQSRALPKLVLSTDDAARLAHEVDVLIATMQIALTSAAHSER